MLSQPASAGPVLESQQTLLQERGSTEDCETDLERERSQPAHSHWPSCAHMASTARTPAQVNSYRRPRTAVLRWTLLPDNHDRPTPVAGRPTIRTSGTASGHQPIPARAAPVIKTSYDQTAVRQRPIPAPE